MVIGSFSRSSISGLPVRSTSTVQSIRQTGYHCAFATSARILHAHALPLLEAQHRSGKAA